LSHIVKTDDAILDHLNVADVVVFDGIQAKLIKDCAAYGVFSFIRICFQTGRIRTAQHGTTVIVNEFGPLNKVAIFIECRIWAISAELVCLTQELIGSKNGEDAENENDEEEYAEQPWDRREHRVDLLLHFG
jgi:hypothetical protein